MAGSAVLALLAALADLDGSGCLLAAGCWRIGIGVGVGLLAACGGLCGGVCCGPGRGFTSNDLLIAVSYKHFVKKLVITVC